MLTHAVFEVHRARRESTKGDEGLHYQLLVTVPKGKSFRVYMDAPGQKKTALKNQIVGRNEFPRAILNTCSLAGGAAGGAVAAAYVLWHS